MKRKIIATLVLLALLCTACNQSKNTFNSKDIRGKYKVDLSSVLEETDGDDWAKGLASLFLASTDITISFYEKDKGLLDATGFGIEFIKGIAKGKGDDIPIPYEFRYKIVNDSVISMKCGDDEIKWALQKVAGSSDVVRVFNPETHEFMFLMRKVGE